MRKFGGNNMELLDGCHEGISVEHWKDFALVSYLHSRSVLVCIASYNVLTFSLAGDDKFLAQLA